MDFFRARISLQSIAMTNKEILQADLLDILFEHRNKAYGAYALRKNYNDRLHWALGISLVAVLILILTLNRKKNSNPPLVESTEITLPTYNPEKANQPDQPGPRVQPRRAQRQYSSQIRIVSDNHKTNMPDQHELQNAHISTHTIGGLPTNEAGSATAPTNSRGNVEAGNVTSETVRIFSTSDAQFPGGIESFKKFLTKNLVMPDDLQVDEKKTVLVRFKVDVDGSISNTAILQSGGDKYDNEVLRVLNKMPKWVPATQNGVKVATWFTQPVSFIGVE
ncbi:MAG: energy transducer TonB [Bacteroidetes bacterium]|nr:MAG: energy transducer TonB [Bacteroidota bacterium]